jgi:hypothetical protein
MRSVCLRAFQLAISALILLTCDFFGLADLAIRSLRAGRWNRLTLMPETFEVKLDCAVHLSFYFARYCRRDAAR